MKENKNPLVSIIIPVYNGENYLSLAIDSALRQTYENIEVIVVNDGSHDNTDKICKSYKNKIKYIKKENGGAASALNEGIKNMNGEYFSWLSHDDLYYREKVEEEINYLKENNLLGTNTILYSNCSYVDEFGYYLGETINDSIDLNTDSAFSILKGGINGLTLLIPKKAFDIVGEFKDELKCTQDYDMWFRMYKEGFNFVHIPNIITITRIHKGSDTNTSPSYLKEVNKFWFKTISSFNDKEKIRLYGSIYNYYYSFYNNIDKRYIDVIDFCNNKCLEIEKKNKEKLKNTKVSVIVIGDKISESTLESVKKQTYKNIETITVNKNAKDINNAIKSSNGNYIAFINSNDSWDKNKINTQLLKLISSELPISHTSYLVNSETINSGFYTNNILGSMLKDFSISLSTIMVDKKFIEKNNILFDEKYKEEMENYFILDLLKHSNILGIKNPISKVSKKNNCNIELYLEINKNDKTIKKYIKNLDIYKDKTIEEKHKKELERYEYLQTKEWKRIKKIKKVFRNISFRKEKKEYLITNEELFNNKVKKCYDKIKNIKRKK